MHTINYCNVFQQDLDKILIIGLQLDESDLHMSGIRFYLGCDIERHEISMPG